MTTDQIFIRMDLQYIDISRLKSNTIADILFQISRDNLRELAKANDIRIGRNKIDTIRNLLESNNLSKIKIIIAKLIG